MRNPARGLLLVALLSTVLALAPPPAAAQEPAPAVVIWEGRVLVNESVTFGADRTLVIRPGTEVRIRALAPSCTEGSAPLVTVAGGLVADGNGSARIRFIYVTEDGEVCAAGREALLVYAGPGAGPQSLSFADFTGGSFFGYRTALDLHDCTFNLTQVRFSGDASTVRNCTFRDSPLSVFPPSRTVIASNVFGRGLPDESGIYLYDCATVTNNTISGCVSGIEASIWVGGTVSGNDISGCLEAINSTGTLRIAENRLTGNGIGVRSWAGLDRLSGNLIAGNDIGVASLGPLEGTRDNLFIGPGGERNRLADVNEMVLAAGSCGDANGQPLRTPVTITDSGGRTVFSGDPEFVVLTAYERLPDGSERRHLPFTATASKAGARNSTTLDGTYSISFTLRLDLYPDLSVRSLGGPIDGASPGDRVPLTVRVQNLGQVPARNFRIAVYIDGEVAYRQPVDSLSPGGWRNLTFDWTATPGKHTVRAVADSGMDLAELSEGNNQRSLPAVVRSAPPPPRAMAIGMVILTGAALALVAMSSPRR